MPSQVELSFGEVLMAVEGAADANQVTVTDAKGNRVDDKKTVVTDRMASVGVAPDAAEGVYTVAYRVVSEDGHPIEGSFKFEVSVAAQSGEATPMPINEPLEDDPTVLIAPAPEAIEDSAAESGLNALPWILTGITVVAAAAGAFIVFRRRARD
jgi:hypothetical protein